MKSPCFRRSGRFPFAISTGFSFFCGFCVAVGFFLLRSGCTTQASRSPSSLRFSLSFFGVFGEALAMGQNWASKIKTRLGHTNFSGTETQFVAQTGWGIWRPKSLSSLPLSIHHLVIPSTGLTLDGLWIWLQSFCARGSFLWQYHSYQSTDAVNQC